MKTLAQGAVTPSFLTHVLFKFSVFLMQMINRVILLYYTGTTFVCTFENTVLFAIDILSIRTSLM